MFAKLTHRADRAVGRLYDMLAAPGRRERNAVIALCVYTLAWTAYAAISKSSQGLHYDMTEVIAWSRDLDFGYLKHPPLAAWIVRLWFSVFPIAEWSYYLLAMLMPALALWIVWRLSADYLSIEKRIAGIALLMLVPFFNFHALKFNVNTVLIPLWAATTFWFLRSFVTRSALYATLAGFGAAGCMLGKYWSVVLLAGLALAALIDSRRAAYLKSPAPWITIVVGFAALAPHLIWLNDNNFVPFSYAMTLHGEKSFATAAVGALGYLAGSIGYVAIPLIIVAVLARRSRSALADIAWPKNRDRRLAAAAFWAPFLLPAVVAVATRTEITSLWSMSAWTLLPVLLLSSPQVKLRLADTRRLIGAAVVVPLLMLIAALPIAIAVHRGGPSPAAAHGRLLAEQVERLWRESATVPLRFVAGDEDLVYAVLAHAAERPRALDLNPRTKGDLSKIGEMQKAGVAFVCYAEDSGCRGSAARTGLMFLRGMQLTLTRTYLEMPGKPRRYTITIFVPR